MSRVHRTLWVRGIHWWVDLAVAVSTENFVLPREQRVTQTVNPAVSGFNRHC